MKPLVMTQTGMGAGDAGYARWSYAHAVQERNACTLAQGNPSVQHPVVHHACPATACAERVFLLFHGQRCCFPLALLGQRHIWQ